MYLNKCLKSYIWKRKHSFKTKVHLGCGKRNYLDGWLNIDGNMFTARCDLWLNLDYQLPFPSSSVDCFYSHHVIEHLRDLQGHFNEIARCLKPGGVYRVGAPHGDNAIKKFIENDYDWFSDFPVSRKSLGGRLDNFVFCRNEHLSLVTESYLNEIAGNSGLSISRLCIPSKDSAFPELFKDCLMLESDSNFDCPHTIIVEFKRV